jgi:cytoskeletal protein CcmA (bactofilin family)
MFSRKKPDTEAITTLIGAATVVTGDLDFEGGLHVDGRIVGDVRGGAGSSSLTVGSGGIIEGSVSAEDLVLHGAVRGDVTAGAKVELGPGGQVDGNVSYRVLQMDAGARVNGRLIHHSGSPAEAGGGGTSEPDSGPAGDEAPGVR